MKEKKGEALIKGKREKETLKGQILKMSNKTEKETELFGIFLVGNNRRKV